MSKAKSDNRGFLTVPRLPAALLLAVVPGMLFAMQPLEDQELSSVTGQDGLVMDFAAGNQISIGEVEWRMDAGLPQQASAILRDMEVQFVDGAALELDVGGGAGEAYMVLRGSWSDLQARVGALSHSAENQSIGTFGIRSTGDLTIGNAGGLFDAAGTQAIFDLTTSGDLFYRQSSGVGAPEISFGNIELGFRFTDSDGNPGGQGTFGIVDDALVIRTDNSPSAPSFLDIDLNFDLLFSPSTTQEFDTATRLPMILFGWEGGVRNATIALEAGGFGYGSSTDTNIDPSGSLQFFNYEGQYNAAARSEGLTIRTEWDYNDGFTWILGQAAAPRARADFFDWRRLGAGTAGEGEYDFSLSLIMDAINAGQGPGGICFGGNIPSSGSLTSTSCGTVGGSFQNVPPKANSLAVGIRDGRLHAYNSQVMVRDVDELGVPTEERFNWSLMYTFGKLDANLYFYPDGVYDPVTEQYQGGLRSDVLVAIQSPGYWDAAQDDFASLAAPGTLAGDPRERWATNTHFLIADTDINGVAIGPSPSQAQLDAREAFGIGILNADLLWRVDDFVISLVGDTAPPTADTASSNFYQSNADFPGLWLQTNNLAKYQFRGLLGGGDLSDLSDPARIALIDVNLETDQFTFILGPPREPGEQYVAFDALLNFTAGDLGDITDGAYLTIAEPSNPNAFLGLTNVRGSIAWVDGRVELAGGGQTASGRPELTIANDLLIGSTAFGGNHLISDVNFGQDKLGTIVIPSSQIRSSLSLTPQN